MFRVGVIGCGTVSQLAHLPAIRRTAGLELAAVHDPRCRLAELVAARYGSPRVYETYEDLVADQDLDLVVVLAPSELHAANGIISRNIRKEMR